MLERVSLDLRFPRLKEGCLPKATLGQPIFLECDAFSLPAMPLRVLATVSHEEGVDVFDMEPAGNDTYRAQLTPKESGRQPVTLIASEDPYRAALEGLKIKVNASVAQILDFEDVIQLALKRVTGLHKTLRKSKFHQAYFSYETGLMVSHYEKTVSVLNRSLSTLRDVTESEVVAKDVASSLIETLSNEVLLRICSVPPRREEATQRSFELYVENKRASFGFWYELFPRSFGGLNGVRDVLPHLSNLGVDVVYLPPIHPIGVTKRKGKNNALTAAPDDVGSPWAIGSKLGGHDSIDPSLGTVEEFRSLVVAAREHAIAVALDLALQCSPDHPWVREHPEWFVHRADGSIAHAENPPKRYEDIVPINFFPDKETDRESLWREIHRVVLYWIDNGVRTFRVDNPHTKPMAFWQWLIQEVQRDYDDVVFLAEAFTRPKIMYRLAQIGFTQSYTYFTWRHTPLEVQSYMEELLSAEVLSYFRPNFWPNTPDILAGTLRWGSHSDFAHRVFLAATLVPSYGIYSGYEFLENQPFSETSEEYLDSEKYQIVKRDYAKGAPLDGLIASLNRFRRDHPAMQRLGNVLFLRTEGANLLAYLRFAPETDDFILVVNNFDTKNVTEGAVYLPSELPGGRSFEEAVGYDALSSDSYTFRKGHNFIRLDPSKVPGHLVSLNIKR